MSAAGRFGTQVLRPARIICSIGQMLLGAGLAIALILKVYMAILTDHQCVADSVSLGNAIRCTGTLELMSVVLALAAGLELAYLLFEDSDTRAVRPLLFGLSAAIFYVLSGVSAGTANWELAMTIAVLFAALYAGLSLRRLLQGGLLGSGEQAKDE